MATSVRNAGRNNDFVNDIFEPPTESVPALPNCSAAGYRAETAPRKTLSISLQAPASIATASYEERMDGTVVRWDEKRLLLRGGDHSLIRETLLTIAVKSSFVWAKFAI